jgi:hypothetical protein
MVLKISTKNWLRNVRLQEIIFDFVFAKMYRTGFETKFLEGISPPLALTLAGPVGRRNDW